MRRSRWMRLWATGLALVAAALVAFSLCAPALAEEAGGPPSAATDGPQAAAPVIVPEPTERARRYHESGNLLWGAELALSFALPALLAFSGFSASLRTLAERLGKRRYPTLVIYLALFAVVVFVLELPLAFYGGYLREHAYGLSNAPFAKWMGDALKALFVGTFLGALVVWVPFALIRRAPRTWWLWTAALTVPFIGLMLLIGPLFIEPLFNRFGPMKDKALEAKIVALAERAGIEGGRVFEVDKSADTKKLNAYVTGLGATKRIVLWDTLVAELDEREVLFVMGHEMGHYVLGHVKKSIAVAALLILLALLFVHLVGRRIVERHAERLGFDRLDDIASLPLLILLGNAAAFVTSPAALAFSRHLERESDRFALELTRDNHAGATAFIALQKENLAVPRPGLLFTLFRASHPSIGERVAFMNEYRPWTRGERGRYEDLFRRP